MSRWLNQVNSLLEKLDGQVESVAASSQPSSSLRSTLAQQAQAVASAVATVTTTRASDNGDEEYFSEYDDDEEEITTDDDDEYFTEEQSHEGDNFVEEEELPDEVLEFSEPQKESKAEPLLENVPPSGDPLVMETASTSIESASPDAVVNPSPKPANETPEIGTAIPAMPSVPKPPQLPKERIHSPVQAETAAPPNSQHEQLRQQQSLFQQQIERLKSQHTAEMAQLLQQNEAAIQQVMHQNEVQRQQLRQQNDRLTGELQSLQTELKAVNKELQEAAGIVERERAAMKLERNELLEEQEDEVLQMKSEYEDKILDLRNEMTAMKDQHERQLLKTRQQHTELGDTMDEQLQQITEREQEARDQIKQLQTENLQLQAEVQQWHHQNTALQQQYDVSLERQTVAEAAVAAAEERLDEANAQYRKQLQQRQARETALEQTVAQLSQQTATGTSLNSHIVSEEEKLAQTKAVAEYKAQYSAALEELETVKTELAFTTQRCGILEKEFQDMVLERERDVERTQQLQHDYDHRIQQLMTADQSRTVASDDVRQSNERVQQLTMELRQASDQIQSLSDQCLRQQTAIDTQKTELLAWKSRYQEATSRAEAAESERMNDIELGRPAHATPTHRRRVKGAGGSRYSTLPNRSMRTAVGLSRTMARGRGNNVRDLQEQLGTTVDAMDHWMVETGHILRHEPLARLGFAIYFVMIHVFCFALVAFHTIEAEHGDLGQLTSRRRGVALFQPHDQN
jgi:hypothetical protein